MTSRRDPAHGFVLLGDLSLPNAAKLAASASLSRMLPSYDSREAERQRAMEANKLKQTKAIRVGTRGGHISSTKTG